MRRRISRNKVKLSNLRETLTHFWQSLFCGDVFTRTGSRLILLLCCSMLSLGARPRPHTLADGLKHHVERRDCKYPDEGGEDHPAENRGADAAPRQLRGTRRHDQRKKTEDESERGHHDRTKPQTGAFGCRFEQRNPMF